MNEIIEKIFETISIKDLKERIDNFEKLGVDFEYEEAFNILKKVFLLDVEGWGISAFKSESREYKEGGIFYRARRMNRERIELTHNDFWEAPAEVVPRGRINKPMEPLLYLSPREPYTPIRETHIKNGIPFLLVAYEAIARINVFGIGVGGGGEGGFSLDTEKKLDIVTEFIKRIFMKNDDKAYVLTNVISQEVCKFDYDGWVYPSVANDGGENLCLKLTAKEKLRVHAAFLCQLEDGNIRTTHAIEVSEEILVYDDWEDSEGSAHQIFGSLLNHNRDNSSEIETREDIGFPVNVLRP
ncbi:hypothetical protein ABIE61_003660 [Marinobacterium sp. MBR-111]|jgi:hypothetical protein|uniref:hypothetical protein n=1 Tax=Marinobacterium sp. MBR-111 TaxID=3156463 RepID=UPI0033933DA1